MNDPSYKLDLNPTALDKYSFGKIELDDFQLSNLNLIISKLSQSKEITFNDSFGIEWEFSFVALIDYLFHIIGDQGPFLIISGNYQKWADLISNIDGIVPLIYHGSQQERKSIRSNQLFNPDNTLKFNVLISSPDIDYSSIKDIYCHLTIYHNLKIDKKMPKSYRMIRYTQNYVKAFLSDLREIENFTNESYYAESDSERKQDKIENFENLLTYIPSEPLLTSPHYYYIDCPLCEIQKVVLKKLLFQSEQNFSSLCQKILRVCSHPFLVFGIESLLGPVDYIQSSTKLSVFSKLVTEKLIDAKKILVISQFNGMLDLIEDFATEKDISFDRLVDPEIDYENKDSKLMLYNPLYCQIDIITEFIDYFIIIDGDHSSILNTLLSNPNRRLKSIITLQCQELFETRLTKTCTRGLNVNNRNSSSNCNNSSNSSPYLSSSKSRSNSSSSLLTSLNYQYSYIYCDTSHHDYSFIQYEEFMTELLCKIAAAACLSPVTQFSIDSIIENVSEDPIETGSIFDIQFCQAHNFWDVLKETAEFKAKLEFPLVRPVVDDGKHKWTLRERDQLVRGLVSFGWDRWSDIINSGGLHQLSKEEIIQTSRSILRLLLQHSNRNSPFPLIKQFIRESSNGGQNSSFINDEKADFMFMEKELVFKQPDFKFKMKSNADFFLKRIESLSYLSHTVEAYIGNISSLPISRTIGNSPTITWAASHDQILLIGSYRYGFGAYDHFPEDQDLTYREVSFCAEQRLLNERMIKLTENLKRMHDAGFRPAHEAVSESENSDNFDEVYRETNSSANSNSNANPNSSSKKTKAASSDDENEEFDDSNVHTNLSCHWSKEEKSSIFKYMSDNGIINDFETMRKESHLDGKTAEQVKEYVDDYMERCKMKPEDGGVKGKTAIKIKKRVQAMDELRAILNFELQSNPDLYRFQGGSNSRKSKQKSEDSDDDDYDGVSVSDLDNKRIFEKAPHWKKFPHSWTPNVERFFFAQIAIKGFKSIDEILALCEKKKMIGLKSIPSFVFKFDSLLKRINTFYELLVQTNPSIGQCQNRQNPYFYKFQQSQIQLEQKAQQQSPNKNRKVATISDANRKLNQPSEINSNSEANTNLKQKPAEAIKIKLKPTNETKPTIKLTVKKPVKKAKSENSGENSTQSEEKESSDYSERSDYSDEYKSKNERQSQYNRRPQTARPVASKEELNESHKEQVKQARNKQVQKKKQDQQEKQVPVVNLSIDDFTFPFPITSTSSVLNIGEIVYDRPAFHSERYIYPAGYRSKKVYASIDNPEERANYISEIIDNGTSMPLFRVTMEGSEHVFEGSTPTAPWTNVLKRVFSQGKRKVYSVSGPEAFMIAQPKVSCLIQMLPNAEKCAKYEMKQFQQAVINDLMKCKKTGQSVTQSQQNEDHNVTQTTGPQTAQTVEPTESESIQQQPVVHEEAKAQEPQPQEEDKNSQVQDVPPPKKAAAKSSKPSAPADNDDESDDEDGDGEDDDEDGSAYEEKVKPKSRSSPRGRNRNVKDQSGEVTPNRPTRKKPAEAEDDEANSPSTDEKVKSKSRVSLKPRSRAATSDDYEPSKIVRRPQKRRIDYNTDNDEEDKDDEESSSDDSPSKKKRRSTNRAKATESKPKRKSQAAKHSQEEEPESNDNDDDDDDDGSEYEEKTITSRSKSSMKLRGKNLNEKSKARIEPEPSKKEEAQEEDEDENDEDDDDDDGSAYEEKTIGRSKSRKTNKLRPAKIVKDDEKRVKNSSRTKNQKQRNKEDSDKNDGYDDDKDKNDGYDSDDDDSTDYAYGRRPRKTSKARKAQNRAKKITNNTSSDELSEKRSNKLTTSNDKVKPKIKISSKRKEAKNSNETDNDENNEEEYDDNDDSDSVDSDYGSRRKPNLRRKKK